MGKMVLLIVLAVALICFFQTRDSFSASKPDNITVDATQIIQLLSQIIDNQNKMLQEFGEIKQELAIIKVRATR